MAQSTSFGKMKAKTVKVKGSLGTFGKKAMKTIKKNVRKGKGVAKKGKTKVGY